MPTPHLDALRAAAHAASHTHNHHLFSLLCEPDQRNQLYRELLGHPQVLPFTSRADTKARPSDDGPSQYHQTVHLLTQRAHVAQALSDTTAFSNAPYLALGSGTFMLGLDPTPSPDEHQAQRTLAMRAFHYDTDTIGTLSAVAWQAAAVLPLKQRQFDLALLAEQAALRFVGFMFGLAQADIALLERSMRLAYAGMGYQMFARHFVTSPGTLLEATGGMGALLVRVAQLIDLYQAPVGRVDTEEADTLAQELAELRTILPGFTPVLQRLADQPGGFSGTELAATVVGSIAGIVGNVQASITIAIQQFFALNRLAQAQAAPDSAALQALVLEALRLRPPAPFLPRLLLRDNPFGAQHAMRAGEVVLLAIGAATRDDGQPQPDQFRAQPSEDPLIFGGERPHNLHQCLGKYLALPLVTHVVQQVLRLPGLDRVLDPRTGEPGPLVQRWGFSCDSFPLQYTLDKALIQQPLNVVMPLKTPLSVHAEMVKKIIAYGAPRIQRRLDQSRHVHFAWFNLQNNDSELALHTVFDGDFDAYIEHFALQVGPLFDQLLQHIQHAPPLPVAEFPKEFVDTIRRFHQPPVGGYFYSAHPLRTVDKTIPAPRTLP